MATTANPTPELRAEYTNTSSTSPSQSFTLITSLPSVPPPAIQPPTEYLRALRTAITDAQAQVNAALTARMEEDKLRDAAAAVEEPEAAGGKRNGKSNKRKKGKTEIDEEAEEMNYGEEIVGED